MLKLPPKCQLSKGTLEEDEGGGGENPRVLCSCRNLSVNSPSFRLLMNFRKAARPKTWALL